MPRRKRQAASQQKWINSDFVLELNTSIWLVLSQHSAPVLSSLKVKNKLRWKIQVSNVFGYFWSRGRKRKLWEALVQTTQKHTMSVK